MNIIRYFEHRTHGEIGSVELDVSKGKFVLNGTELPEKSVEHLLRFSLQTLQDAYAGAKNLDEAIGAFNGKLDKLLAGTIGTRSAGEGVDERTRVQRSVTMAAAKAKFGAKSPEWATFTGLSDEDQAAKLDAWFEAFAEALTPEVEAEIERRAAKRNAKKNLAAGIAFKL